MSDEALKRRRNARQGLWSGIATWLAMVVLGLIPLAAQAKAKTPNILFAIMDDVGIDQMKLLSYGGATPPSTPAIDTLAAAGIRFRNTWSMPACSTSRAVIFTGRFPLRTQVYGALGPSDLANSQVSPYEMTLPRLLRQSGCRSALFGKFHLGLQGKQPFRDAMPHALGWDCFYGGLDATGDPSSIDRTAGNVGAIDQNTGKGPFGCGFVPGAAEGGADQGACCAASGKCQELELSGGVPPGRQCRDSGGILDPNARCKERMPSNIRCGFQNPSAHCVSPLVINGEDGAVVKVPPQDIRARTYRGTAPVDAAIDWIKRQPKHQPWMASVSFASAHTPVMQPPQALLTADPADTSALTCTDGDKNPDQASQRTLTNLMIEALDSEFARLLVSTGLAKRRQDGTLEYNPHDNDTMIVSWVTTARLAIRSSCPSTRNAPRARPTRPAYGYRWSWPGRWSGSPTGKFRTW
jgi:Sulfatase